MIPWLFKSAQSRKYEQYSQFFYEIENIARIFLDFFKKVV